MLFLIIAWLILAIICLTIGSGILHFLKAACFHRLGDRFILATWLGVLLLAWALLTISLVFPLTPWVGVIVASVLVFFSLSIQITRQEIKNCFSVITHLSSQDKVIFLLPVCLMAFLASQPVTWFDTGLYHYQAIEWFAKYGTVPGLALIHSRFGTNSAWFALTAPFNTGILTEKISSLSGGFVYLLAILQITINVRRILKNSADLVDWFSTLSLFLAIPTLFWSTLSFSSSPDQPVILVTIITAWSILIIAKFQGKLHSYSALIPLILTSLAVSLKLSALPLVILAFSFYIFNHKIQIKKLIIACALSSALILPILIFNVITSGCMLYPSSLFCFDLPWSVGSQVAKNEYQAIQQWNQWIGSKPINAQPWDWILPWIDFEGQLAFLIFCSFLAFFLTIRQRYKFSMPGKLYVIYLGILGIIYVMYSAPTWRFGLGYASILPALWLAHYCYQQSRLKCLAIIAVSGASNLWLNLSSSLIIVAIITILMSVSVYFKHRNSANSIFLTALFLVSFTSTGRHYIMSRSSFQFNLLLPPPLSSTYSTRQFEQHRTNDILYFSPPRGDMLCWSAPLPCTHALTHEKIRLRNPQQGMGGGFVREDQK